MTQGMITMFYCTVCKKTADADGFARSDKGEVRRHVEQQHPGTPMYTALGTRSVPISEFDPDSVEVPKTGKVHVLESYDPKTSNAQTECGSNVNVVESYLGHGPTEDDDRCQLCYE